VGRAGRPAARGAVAGLSGVACNGAAAGGAAGAGTAGLAL